MARVDALSAGGGGAAPGGEVPSQGDSASELSDRIRCSEAEFRHLRDYLYAATGIFLPDHKRALVEGRLAKRLRELELASFRQYFRHLQDRKTGPAELSAFVNALTTNKTEFWREPKHFDQLRNHWLPERIQARLAEGQRMLRIWSAGCSSGEEAYGLAICLLERAHELAGWDVRVLATDIDSESLAKARTGLYSEERIGGLPVQFRQKYFTRLPGTDRPKQYEVGPQLREMVRFRRLNLRDIGYPFSRTFDVIFFRNVMIYFDNVSREHALCQMAKHLAPGGFLVIGHAESLLGLNHSLTPHGPTVFRKEW